MNHQLSQSTEVPVFGEAPAQVKRLTLEGPSIRRQFTQKENNSYLGNRQGSNTMYAKKRDQQSRRSSQQRKSQNQGPSPIRKSVDQRASEL